MTRWLFFLLTILLAASAAGWAAANPVVGKWACVATDSAGQQSSWTMTVKEEAGKLSGTLAGDPGEFQLVEPKLAGNAFTFKIIVNEAAYTVETKIDGKALAGKYNGPEASGTIKGTRQ